MELDNEELVEVIRQVVDHDVNCEVERAIRPIRAHSRRCMFAGTAMVVALVLLAILTGDDSTLGPAFVFGIICVCWVLPVLLKSRRRRIEVRVRWREEEGPGAFEMEFRDWHYKIISSLRESGGRK
jgi:hypothetical protein